MSKCPSCGGKVTPDESFCGNCGIQLPLAVVEAPSLEESEISLSPPEMSGGAAQAAEEIKPAGPSEPSAKDDVRANGAVPSEEQPAGLSGEAAASAATPLTIGSTAGAELTENSESAGNVESRASSDLKDQPTSAQVVGSATEVSEEPVPLSSAGGAAEQKIHNTDSEVGTKRTTGGQQLTGIKQLDGGTVLNNRYEIVRRIGGGGMGAVYLAKDRNLGDAPRAVKEMVETHLDQAQHEKAIGDFKRESLLLTSLEHPSIPTIYDYFYDNSLNRFYLVMKFISGGDLASRLRSSPGGRVDEKTVTDWAMQVADVLEYLHTRPKPIIYRDLKPANLMIDGNTSRVMLIDFGIARWVAKQEKGVTAVGTMGYAPPELFSGRVEPRSDVYSLGATMFHLLTGADPQDNPLLIFDFAKNPRPRQIAPAISTEMERLLMRAVEYKPEDRFRSAGELRNLLAEHLEKLMSGHVSYGVPAPQLGGETVQVQTVFCGFCGGRIAVDDIFCAHCGARQPLAAMAASAALHAVRPTAKLVVAGTTELDSSFILAKDSNLVGRADPHSNIFPEVDLSRFDPETKVSRRHARIWSEGETFLVEDLGSVNGTVINDSVRLAPRQPRVLDSGDKIRLGETTLHFLVG